MNDMALVVIIRMGARALTLDHFSRCSFSGGSEMLRDGDTTDDWASNEARMK